MLTAIGGTTRHVEVHNGTYWNETTVSPVVTDGDSAYHTLLEFTTLVINGTIYIFGTFCLMRIALFRIYLGDAELEQRVWKYSIGQWETEGALLRPMNRHRSFYFNNRIWHHYAHFNSPNKRYVW